MTKDEEIVNSVDSASVVKLKGLVPGFIPVVAKIMKDLKDLGYQPRIMEAVRTRAQQAEKVRLGYSQTMNSKHIGGKAVDIVDKRYNWDIPLNHQYWYDQ